MPRLRVNLISKGKYWQVGQEIPAEELPSFALPYVVADGPDAGGTQVIHQRTVKLYVRRGNGFRLAEEEQPLIAGEAFYKKRPTGGYVKTGKFVPEQVYEEGQE